MTNKLKIGDRVVITRQFKAFEKNVGAAGEIFDIKGSLLAVEWDQVSVALTTGQVIDESFVDLVDF
jgi:hypothetical protein